MAEEAIPRAAATASVDRRGWVGSLVILPLVTVAYVVSGRLGLLVAVPPGYATAIFPPAGIACGAVLIAGPRRSAPWIFLGSFALNIWIGRDAHHGVVLVGAVSAGLIAAASTLQAVIVAGALRRSIGYPMALDTGGDLLRFLTLSPLGCLVSATLSVAGLAALGVVGDSAALASWVTWWVGDTLGVLVVLPLILIAAGEPRPLWRSRARPVALPMLLFFGFFVAVFIHVSAWENNQALLEFRLRSQETVDRIRSRLEEQQLFLEQLAGSFRRAEGVSRADFNQLVQGMLRRVAMVQAVEWAPRVEAGQRAAFVAAQRAEIPGYAIRGPEHTALLARAIAPNALFPVAYILPMAGNEAALGEDLLGSAALHTAAAITLATGTVAATSPVVLVPGSPPGIALLLAVRGQPAGGGLLMAALGLDELDRNLPAGTTESLDLRLVDLAGGRPLFDGFPAEAGPPLYRQSFYFGGRHYDVQTVPSPLYMRNHRGWQSWALLSLGVFGIGLLGALLMLGTGYASRIARQVEARTGDLAEANRQLRIEADERRNAEEALRHAQRMEAIGQLTGGIAHDFNNLLTVISANAELIRRDAVAEPQLRRSDGILRAAARGERLTRQLLAFSRRTMLRPETMDLRQRTSEIAEMLLRSMRPDIDVKVSLPDNLWPVSVDPAEFELALLNIAVNARDAMPSGGQFRVTARNMSLRSGTPEAEGLVGEFVALSLSDTGTGMSEEVRVRAFEPYFTTKEVGAGSGLGLSQVYGFASQSGGTATVASRLGAGTTVTLYLPRGAAPAHGEEGTLPPPGTASRAKILVVEDEPEIAEVTTAMLRGLGYEAIHVADAASALAVLASDHGIGLVITDIVMPGTTSGLQLARSLREHRPELPVLLVTGYSQHGAEVAREAFELLEKPYRQEALAEAVRAALGTKAPAG